MGLDPRVPDRLQVVDAVSIMTNLNRPVSPTLVAILHPSASFRRGLAAALNADSFIHVDPPDLKEWLAGKALRVVIVGDGTEEAVIAGSGEATVVLVLVPALEVDAYRRALAIGAHGVAHVDADPDTITHVVRSAVTGEVVLPTEIARRLAGRVPSARLELSQEELGLLQRLSDGATVVELADEFYLAERSVRRRLQNVYIRLGVSGRAAALKRASQLGLIE